MSDPVTESFFRLDVAGLSRSLTVTSFSGHEAVSELFAFELDVLDEEAGPDLGGLMYRSCFLALGKDGQGIHAQIQGVNLRCAGLARGHFRLHLGPRLGCLAQRWRRRLFQQRSVPGIIAQVLGEHGLGNDAFRFVLKGRGTLRPYCVQFDESDLQFIQRLCAEEGIHFHFCHTRNNHRLVFADSLGALRRAREARFCPDQGAGVRDFCVSLSGQGRRRAGRSQESAQGESDLPGLHCASFMPLSGHPCAPWNRLWLLTALEHRGDSNPMDPRSMIYSNIFRATSWEVAVRTPTRYPRPKLSGLFRAWVVADKHGARYDARGRLAVQLLAFYQGEGASHGECWLPLAQPTAGEPQAFAAGLEPGTNVWVRFLEGDPDRPRIVGRCDARCATPTRGSGQRRPGGSAFELLREGHPLVLLCPPALACEQPASCDCPGTVAGGQGGVS
ncbi:contractile injection system protein, VgrG/Pvc8 family [Pseudomonas gingeri]